MNQQKQMHANEISALKKKLADDMARMQAQHENVMNQQR